MMQYEIFMKSVQARLYTPDSGSLPLRPALLLAKWKAGVIVTRPCLLLVFRTHSGG